MKIILETSVYLIMMTLISLISLDFIGINKQIAEADQVFRYIEDYVEIHAHNESLYDTTEVNTYKMDQQTHRHIQDVLNTAGMEIEYSYEEKTDAFIYYRYDIQYDIKMKIFNISKANKYTGYFRINNN